MDIVGQLKRQAQEIADEGHNGWGNTMLVAANEIELLRNVIAMKNAEKKRMTAEWDPKKHGTGPFSEGAEW